MAKHATNSCFCNKPSDSATRVRDCQSFASSERAVFPTSSSEFTCRNGCLPPPSPEQVFGSTGCKVSPQTGYVWTCTALKYAFCGAASAGLLGNGKIIDFIWVSDAFCAAIYDTATHKISVFRMDGDSGRPFLVSVARLDAMLAAAQLPA